MYADGNDVLHLLLRPALRRLIFLFSLLLLLLFNLRLLLPHGMVAAAKGKKLIMRAALENDALIQNHDLIRGRDCGQSVSTIETSQ